MRELVLKCQNPLLEREGICFWQGTMLPVDSQQHLQPREERQMDRSEDSNAGSSGTGSTARASVIRMGTQKSTGPRDEQGKIEKASP